MSRSWKEIDKQEWLGLQENGVVATHFVKRCLCSGSRQTTFRKLGVVLGKWLVGQGSLTRRSCLRGGMTFGHPQYGQVLSPCVHSGPWALPPSCCPGRPCSCAASLNPSTSSLEPPSSLWPLRLSFLALMRSFSSVCEWGGAPTLRWRRKNRVLRRCTL